MKYFKDLLYLKRKVLQISLLFIPIYIIIACNSEKSKIEKYLFSNSIIYWDVYNNNFTKTGYSYKIKEDYSCILLCEVSGYEFGNKIISFDKRIDSTWTVFEQEKKVYIRLLMDVYKVLDYNSQIIKVINKDGNIYYLNKSSCITNDCIIPYKIKPQLK